MKPTVFFFFLIGMKPTLFSTLATTSTVKRNQKAPSLLKKSNRDPFPHSSTILNLKEFSPWLDIQLERFRFYEEKKPPHVASSYKLNKTVPTHQALHTSSITSSQDTQATNQELKKTKKEEIQHTNTKKKRETPSHTRERERERDIQEQIKLNTPLLWLH